MENSFKSNTSSRQIVEHENYLYSLNIILIKIVEIRVFVKSCKPKFRKKITREMLPLVLKFCYATEFISKCDIEEKRVCSKFSFNTFDSVECTEREID